MCILCFKNNWLNDNKSFLIYNYISEYLRMPSLCIGAAPDTVSVMVVGLIPMRVNDYISIISAR